jgi:hypothetical protein
MSYNKTTKEVSVKKLYMNLQCTINLLRMGLPEYIYIYIFFHISSFAM